MADLHHLILVVLLLEALFPPAVQSHSQESTNVPDQFEFVEAHAYMGSDSVRWKRERPVFVRRVAEMKGEGAFDESVEELNPTPEMWRRFWGCIDSLGVWQWESDYSDPKRDRPDGESWTLTLRAGPGQLKSKGHNAAPNTYSEFRDAVYKLMNDARRHKRK
jgi:hypothetical protein